MDTLVETARFTGALRMKSAALDAIDKMLGGANSGPALEAWIAVYQIDCAALVRDNPLAELEEVAA